MDYSKSNIMVAGEHIIDKYLIGTYQGNRFTPERFCEFPGCAGNVLQNIKHITSNKKQSISLYYVGQPIEDDYYRTSLIRLIDYDNTKPTIEYWDNLENFDDCLGIYEIPYHIATEPAFNVLVLADYGKGALSTYPISGELSTFEEIKFDVTIVDSKHRSLAETYLPVNSVRIWHATSDEYDSDWAQDYNYVLHTNGPKVVGIQDVRSNDWHFLQVPETLAVDTCGAGDTFVAGVSSWLADVKSTKLEDIIEASEFGIKCAQSVIQKRYTAHTDIKL
jgi:bifunctional ADP-heptose synthase (sugar kinase/adenylyltransferase)